jgi:glycosyltransferase involved in cell wall biosynthesis
MRIGLMLRAWGERGGVGVYTRNLVRELLDLDAGHHYLLMWRQREHLGTFAGRPGVEERWLWAPGKAAWDQLAVPWTAWRERLDVVLHPKFTAPLLAPCPAVMVVHGADWWRPEEARFYGWLDTRYVRAFMPLYFRKCAAVISVSHQSTAGFERALRPPAGKLRTVHFGPASCFRTVDDPAELERVRARHRLPARFFLTVAKASAARRKNLPGLLDGYRRYHRSSPEPLPLVVVGEVGDRGALGLPAGGWGGDVHLTGWLEQAELPAVYSLATAFLYPSHLEAFPIPLTEAMACGTPIVTSERDGPREIAGDAARFVDPDDPGAIAAALRAVATDPELRRELRRRGLERVPLFSWRRCAERVLAILEEVAEEEA